MSAVPLQLRLIAVETVLLTVRVTVKTIGFWLASAPVASVAAIAITGVSLSAIEPLAIDGVPTVYGEPGPSAAGAVRTTVSVGSMSVSSTGVAVIVALVTPAASVRVKPFAPSVPPVAVRW